MEIEFTATIPPIKNAISIDGNGDGAEVKLSIPRSDMKAVLALQLMTGNLLNIRVSVDGEIDIDKKQGRQTEQI